MVEPTCAISVKLDPNYQFIIADPHPSAIIGDDSLIWDFNPISLLCQQWIHITRVVNSAAMLGLAFFQDLSTECGTNYPTTF
jgi:hypothetical protein